MLNKIFKKDIQDYKAKDLMTKHVITLQSQDNLLIAQRTDVTIIGLRKLLLLMIRTKSIQLVY